MKNTLATALAASGRHAEAVAAFKGMLAHNPSHADKFNARLILVLLYVQLGRERNTRTEAAEVLKRGSNYRYKVFG